MTVDFLTPNPGQDTLVDVDGDRTDDPDAALHPRGKICVAGTYTENVKIVTHFAAAAYNEKDHGIPADNPPLPDWAVRDCEPTTVFKDESNPLKLRTIYGFEFTRDHCGNVGIPRSRTKAQGGYTKNHLVLWARYDGSDDYFEIGRVTEFIGIKSTETDCDLDAFKAKQVPES